MRLNLFHRRPGSKKESRSQAERKELVIFVSDQFKQLAKRKLRVPIQLYHL